MDISDKTKAVTIHNAVKNEVNALRQKLSDVKVIILVLAVAGFVCLALSKNYMLPIILRLN